MAFCSSLDVLETKSHFSYLNSYLELRTFLDGAFASENDRLVFTRLKEVPGLPTMLASRQRPTYLSRWWTHMSTVYQDPEFDLKWKKQKAQDLRMLKALRAKDFAKAIRFIDVTDLNTKFPNYRASQAIHYSAKMEQPHLARELLKRGVDVNSKDGDGMTPLLFAVMKSNDELIELFLEHGADVMDHDGQYRNLIYIASNVERLDLVDRFIQLGCDPNLATLKGRTALAKAAWNGQFSVVSHLLAIPSISIDAADIYGRTALFAAVWGSSGGRDGIKYSKKLVDSPDCAELLISHGADIEHQDRKGNTPLFTAVDTNAPLSTDLLINHKANIFHTNKTGKSALHKAVKSGCIECAAKLIEAGVSVNYSVVSSVTPMMSCIASGSVKSAEFLASFSDLEFLPEYIPACINKGDAEILELLLSRFNITEADPSLLYQALTSQKWKVAAVLGKICEVNTEHIKAASKDKDTLVSLLQFYKGFIEFDFIKSAIDEGLFTLILPYTKDKFNWATMCEAESQSTVLHLLAAKGDILPAQELLEVCDNAQALILLNDSNEMTAIDTARISNHNSFADYLESYLGEFESHFKVLKPEYEDLSDSLEVHPLPPPTQHSFPKLEFKTASSELEVKLVDTAESISELHRKIMASPLIGLDIECYSIDDLRHYIALMQITVDGVDYVVDALRNREQLGHMMRDIMISPFVIKVMHGCDVDLILLQLDFQAFSINVFDTARAYCCIHNTKNLESYANLVKGSFGLKIDKTYQVSDWRIRPLPRPMLQYARNDSHYLPELYSIFRESMTEPMLMNLQSKINKLTHKPMSRKHKRIRLLEPTLTASN